MEAKESLEFEQFHSSNIKKVPAEIFFKKKGDFLFFQQVFEGLEIIGLHLLKKDEWFHGIYLGARRIGYIYDGDAYNLEQQAKIFQEYAPANYNRLQDFVKQYAGRIDYHKCRNDMYRIIGKLEDKELIQKVKKIRS